MKKCSVCKENMSFEMLKGYICINTKCKKTYGHTFISKNEVIGATITAMKYKSSIRSQNE